MYCKCYAYGSSVTAVFGLTNFLAFILLVIVLTRILRLHTYIGSVLLSQCVAGII